jgi:hypothetical protein
VSFEKAETELEFALRDAVWNASLPVAVSNRIFLMPTVSGIATYHSFFGKDTDASILQMNE